MNNQTTSEVLDIFQNFRMTPTAIDEYEVSGKGKLAAKLQPYIDAKEPIDFVMLGFPFKSMNDRDKVLGKLPDLCEELSMQQFANFHSSISSVYKPGINVTIVSDGFMFNDLMNVYNRTVIEYAEMVHDLGRVAPMTWYDASDFYSSKLSLNEIREKIMSHFGLRWELLEQRILMDMDVNWLYKGMMRFMEQDLAIRVYDSRNQLHKAAKLMARQMMLRNEAYSELVRKEFPNHIRLSMHPSVNNGSKYSFQIINSPRAWTSPWHSAILKDEQGVATIHRKDAEAAGYQVIKKDGRPYYFTAV